MAQYSELPVYKSSYDLLLIIFQFVKNFTKEYKYTLGEKLKNECTPKSPIFWNDGKMDYWESPLFQHSIIPIFEEITFRSRLKNETMELLVNIYRSNSVNEKKNTIQNARESIEVIRLLIRLSKDLHLVDLKKFVFINEKVEVVSKQLTGWQKSQK